MKAHQMIKYIQTICLVFVTISSGEIINTDNIEYIGEIKLGDKNFIGRPFVSFDSGRIIITQEDKKKILENVAWVK